MEAELTALRAGNSLLPGKIPGMHFCQRLSRPQGHCARLEAFGQLKISSDFIGNPTCDLGCRILPQPNTLFRAPPPPPPNNQVPQELIFTSGSQIIRLTLQSKAKLPVCSGFRPPSGTRERFLFSFPFCLYIVAIFFKLWGALL
jgi:hypothetical protein